MSTTELVTKLRSTKSESKRKLLDEAADTIERLEAERNELAIAALREQEEYEIQRHLKRFDLKEPRTINANDEPSQIEKLAARYERNMHKPWKKTKTNADRIRAMSDEELAEMLSPYMCPYNGEDYTRLGGVLKWLKQPAKEDA